MTVWADHIVSCETCGRRIVKMPHAWWHYDEAANEDHEAVPTAIAEAMTSLESLPDDVIVHTATNEEP